MKGLCSTFSLDICGALLLLVVAPRPLPLPTRSTFFHIAHISAQIHTISFGLQDLMTGGRLVLPNFLSLDTCKELEFVHKSCSVVGYKPHVLSTTLSHLIATNCAELIIPFISIRDSLREVVEDHFGCEFELFVEFTGLISWTQGATIGWHSDSNQPYLRQRHYSAVCYLNNYGEDFEGGLFHFQQGEPHTLVPSTVVIYTADEQNIHCVDEVTSGERCTLAMWFTRDHLHNEDARLIKQLSEAFIYCDLLHLLEKGVSSESRYFDKKLQSSSQQQDNGGAMRSTHENYEIKLPANESYSKGINSIKKKASSNEWYNSFYKGVVDIEAVRCNADDKYMNSSALVNTLLPKAASSTMYWFVHDDQSQVAENESSCKNSLAELLERNGDNICELRLACLGFECFQEIECLMPTSCDPAKMSFGGRAEVPSSSNLQDVTLSFNGQIAGRSKLETPLMLQFKEEPIPYVFKSCLHALSVVQYFVWRKSIKLSLDADVSKSSSMTIFERHSDEQPNFQLGELVAQPAKKLCRSSMVLSESYQENIKTWRKIINSGRISHQQSADLAFLDKLEFVSFIQQWEDYIFDLWKMLLYSLPYWKASSCIFHVKS
ncbi:hypothetical protein O6H91_03G015300 [Diphasiastrum complanatum]|uniref:Uncharacterized protein n=1 Tax=Diphasiastrum complanatum TaxID=34168 RepID=A0ACC2E3N1_DIPCM|nr:hypothetical protein O6H91_03G015300 [Diphasiastrum complanatum]